MTIPALALSLLVASINYSTSTAITLCTGTMGLRGHPTTDLLGQPSNSENGTLPVNRSTTVVLPSPFSSSMYCWVSEMFRSGKRSFSGDSGRKSSVGYYRILSCGEKRSNYMIASVTETDDKGFEHASLSIVEPRFDGRGAIFRIDVVCGTD